ncbi:MAG: DUF2939 domain-containing protein [Agitococcus sp.]|nr:DUF2939 domain-containing protein [Agitococcus sp.]MDO9179145.1 DUF2939 domain-containing protein [Agitococcus sp.]
MPSLHSLQLLSYTLKLALCFILVFSLFRLAFSNFWPRVNQKMGYNILSLCIAILTTSYATPYVAIWNIAIAYQKQNTGVLESYIDFTALRQSAKDAVLYKMTGGVSEEKSVAGSVASYVVNSVVTPQGLATFLAVQREPMTGTPFARLDIGGKPKVDFSQIHMGYESFDVFVIRIDGQTAMSETISLVFNRRQLSWVLTGVRF